MENPSLSYLHVLSIGNEQFKSKIIKLLKVELPLEYQVYELAFKANNYFLAAEIVHKIKHKIAFFQMEQSYSIAELHELALKDGKLKYKEEFIDIVTKIFKFIADCNELDYELSNRR
jgi:hypothetical protein